MDLADTTFDARLKRDRAVLTTLAHLRCANFHHLHTLCFPGCVVATARVGLSNLFAAGYVTHSRWMVRRDGRERGYIWTITSRGLELLSRYGALPDASLEVDLGRPSTAVENNEWLVCMDVRTLIVALILEARCNRFFDSLQVTVSHAWPGASRPRSPEQPDAILSVVWYVPTAKENDWLPWWTTASTAAQPIHYPVYFDRAAVPFLPQQLEDILDTTRLEQPCVPIVVLHNDERYRLAEHALLVTGNCKEIRLSTWEMLSTGVGTGNWRDGQGRPCALQTG